MTWWSVLLQIHSLLLKNSLQQKIQVCGKLQQPIQWLQQLHIWQQCPPFKRDATWKISFKYIQYFFRCSDLQQNLIKNAAFCSNQVIWQCPDVSYMIVETKIHHHAKFHIFCRKWSLHLHPFKLAEYAHNYSSFKHIWKKKSNMLFLIT